MNRSIRKPIGLFAFCFVFYSLCYLFVFYTKGIYYEDVDILNRNTVEYIFQYIKQPPTLTNEYFLVYSIMNILYRLNSNIYWFDIYIAFVSVLSVATIAYFFVRKSKNIFISFITLSVLMFFCLDFFVHINNLRIATIYSCALILYLCEFSYTKVKNKYQLFIPIVLSVLAICSRLEVPLLVLSIYVLAQYILNKKTNRTIIAATIMFAILVFSYFLIETYSNYENQKGFTKQERLIVDLNDFFILSKTHPYTSPKDSMLYTAKIFFINDKYTEKVQSDELLENTSWLFYFENSWQDTYPSFLNSMKFSFEKTPLTYLSFILICIPFILYRKISFVRVLYLVLLMTVLLFFISISSLMPPKFLNSMILFGFIMVFYNLIKLNTSIDYLIIIAFIGLLQLIFFENRLLKDDLDHKKLSERVISFINKYQTVSTDVYIDGVNILDVLPNKLFYKKNQDLFFFDFAIREAHTSFNEYKYNRFGKKFNDLYYKFKKMDLDNNYILLSNFRKLLYVDYMSYVYNRDLQFYKKECLNDDLCIYKISID